MTLDTMDYKDGDLTLEAAIAWPSQEGPAPAVLIVHQWAGRGDGEHAAAERLASEGYVGIAVDMFGKGVIGDPSGDNTHLIAPLLGDRQALARRMSAAVAFAKGLEGVDSSSIAAIGYCFGGLCVLDLARTGSDDVAGVVSLHGILDGNGLAATGPILAKVLVEHGWLDPMAPPAKVDAFGEEMKVRKADWQIHVHGRAMHAFTAEGANAPEKGILYDADADSRSWQSTVEFLAATFGDDTHD